MKERLQNEEEKTIVGNSVKRIVEEVRQKRIGDNHERTRTLEQV